MKSDIHSLEIELKRAERAFEQNPTPQLSAAIKRVCAAIKRQQTKQRRESRNQREH
jgi:hypothetical protein